jgi:hypothetical protein
MINTCYSAINNGTTMYLFLEQKLLVGSEVTTVDRGL